MSHAWSALACTLAHAHTSVSGAAETGMNTEEGISGVLLSAPVCPFESKTFVVITAPEGT